MHGKRLVTTERKAAAVRLKRRATQEAARTLRLIEATLIDFERVALDLERQIAGEEERTGITDPAHFAYSTIATAARRRRSNLSVTIADLTARLDGARREHDSMAIELYELEPPEPRDLSTEAQSTSA
jgi:flagellar FliJ protein